MVKNHLQKEAAAKMHFDPKPPHFFKIILQDTVEHGKLVFPKRFIKMHGENLSKSVRLRVPTGEVWEMELQKCGGDVWLEKKEWGSFASFYAIGFGHLLVFRFVQIEIPEFEVIIFGRNTLEIEYPKVRSSNKAEPSDSGHMRNQEQVTQLKPLTKMKISRNKFSYPMLKKLQKEEKRDQDRKKQASKMQPLNATAKAEALLRTRSFCSTNAYFKLVMQPSYVRFPFILCLPIRFMQTYIPEDTDEVNLVSASNGKTWTTRYYMSKVGGKSFLQARIYHGWDKFVKENRLEVGDVGIFELIKVAEVEVSFKITIFKAPQAAKLNNGDDEVASTSKPVPRHPSFQIVIPNSVTSLNIPKMFAKRHFNLEREEQMLTLEVEDRLWLVKLLSNKHRASFAMSRGLSTFMKENSLKVGDFCTFELIDSNQMVFKVSITRNHAVKEE